MLPHLSVFIQRMTDLGVGLDSEVVCYDGQGTEWAARAASVLSLFGHRNLAILSGGLKVWNSVDRATLTVSAATPINFNYQLMKESLKSYDEIRKIATGEAPAI